MIRCSMTGLPMSVEDGIYDGGEWFSWEWINGQLYKQEIQQEYPQVDPEQAMLFEVLVQNAADYHSMTVLKATIRPMVKRLDPTFDEQTYGVTTFSELLKLHTELFEVRKGQHDQEFRMRERI